jgi:dTMP kinase
VETSLEGREDRFEQQDFAFHQKVREGYLKIAAQNPNRFIILDATLDQKQLHQEIVTLLEPYLDDTD